MIQNLVILYGGKSGEHEVSLLSAASIVRHLDLSRFRPLLVGIAKDGTWHLQDADLAARERAKEGPLPLLPGPRVLASPGSGLVVLNEGPASSTITPLPCDLVFPVLHGSFGEDGTVQGMLEVAGLPYVGAGVLGSALGMDKEKSKELFMRAGLPTVPFIVVRQADLKDSSVPASARSGEEALTRKVGARFGWPVFVKPAGAGSSVGASKVAAAELLLPALREALLWDSKALVEPFIDGREIECSVLGNAQPVAYSPGEILPTHEFYDYEAKYIDPDGARLVVPAELSAEQSERLRSTAVAAFLACEICGMARVDFFVDRRTGEILLNELNTIPGFTHISMYPRMCQVGGLSYSELITKLAELALERHAERSALRFSR